MSRFDVEILGTPDGKRAQTSSEIAPTWTERALAMTLLLLSSPVFVVLAGLLWLRMGWPIFYRGDRLGANLERFTLIKFRTLPIDIQQRLGGRLFSEQQERLPMIARFLRETRLDELPQLINIARGQMQFIGPRPERPEVYQRILSEMSTHEDYHSRFHEPPGLIGVSQVLTPHSAPKRMRTRLDCRYSRSRQQFGVVFLLWGVLMLIRHLIASTVRYVWRDVVRLRLLQRRRDHRTQPRTRARNVWLEIIDGDDGASVHCGQVIDINSTFTRVCFDQPLPKDYLMQPPGRLEVYLVDGERRYKRARCLAQSCHLLGRSDTASHDYLLGYSPVSPFGRYCIDQYILRGSIANRTRHSPGKRADG